MTEAKENDYRALDISAMAYERQALEARTRASELLKIAEQAEATAFALRQEMGRIAQSLTTEGDRDD